MRFGPKGVFFQNDFYHTFIRFYQYGEFFYISREPVFFFLIWRSNHNPIFNTFQENIKLPKQLIFSAHYLVTVIVFRRVTFTMPSNIDFYLIVWVNSRCCRPLFLNRRYINRDIFLHILPSAFLSPWEILPNAGIRLRLLRAPASRPVLSHSPLIPAYNQVSEILRGLTYCSITYSFPQHIIYVYLFNVIPFTLNSTIYFSITCQADGLHIDKWKNKWKKSKWKWRPRRIDGWPDEESCLSRKRTRKLVSYWLPPPFLSVSVPVRLIEHGAVIVYTYPGWGFLQ